jgi:polar amino acid transport system substrate-binding protein
MLLARLLLGVIAVAFVAAAHAAPASAPPLRKLTMCGEPGDGSPWLYWVPDAQGKPTRQLAGFSIELWTQVFSRLGYQLEIHGEYPWRRCLRMVANGEIDFVSGAYFDEERARLFAYSKPYKVLTPQVFFSARKPIEVATIADLQRYRGCGRGGNSYAHYGLDPSQLDLGALSYRSMIDKLKRQHCDYFVEELETIAQVNIGRDHHLDDPDLLHHEIAGARAPAKHLLTGRGRPGEALLPAINAAVEEFMRSEERNRLWRKHAGDLPF